MVGFTGCRNGGTAGEGAAAITQCQGRADGFGEVTVFPTHIKRLGPAAQDDGDQAGVAGQPTGITGAKLSSVAEQLDGAEAGGKSVLLHGDDDVGPIHALAGQVAGIGGNLGEQKQRISGASVPVR